MTLPGWKFSLGRHASFYKLGIFFYATKKMHFVSINIIAVLLINQDFTGVPAVVDLAAMRDAVKVMGKNYELVNPICPTDLVIDHSVQVDHSGS